MAKPDWFSAAQMQALNPILVMLLIPFNNLVLYPLLRRAGMEVTALRRMGAGIAFSGTAWIAAGMLQRWVEGGDAVSITDRKRVVAGEGGAGGGDLGGGRYLK